jgi:dipeptidyl aminopeptidase/acylaminoacyl peptidase
MKRDKLASVGAGSAVVGALAWGAGVAAVYWRAFGRRRRTERVATPADFGVKYEELDLTTGDGIRLSGWYLPGKHHAAVVVSGGYRGRASDVLGIATALQRSGFHVFMYGWRGTPGSDVAAHTLGVYERNDLQAVIDAVSNRLGKVPIGLLGYSMGGSVSISVAATDKRVRGVVSDSAFADPTAVIGDRVKSILRIPSSVLVWPVLLIHSTRTGAKFTDFSPVAAVSLIGPRPILIIHGTKDKAVPVSHAERLFAAARKPKELWLVPDANHVGAYFLDREVYVTRVVGFFEKALLRPQRKPALSERK